MRNRDELAEELFIASFSFYREYKTNSIDRNMDAAELRADIARRAYLNADALIAERESRSMLPDAPAPRAAGLEARPNNVNSTNVLPPPASPAFKVGARVRAATGIATITGPHAGFKDGWEYRYDDPTGGSAWDHERNLALIEPAPAAIDEAVVHDAIDAGLRTASEVDALTDWWSSYRGAPAVPTDVAVAWHAGIRHERARARVVR